MAIVGGAPGYAFTIKDIFAHAPDESGVYALFNTSWLFFGEGDNVRRCLLLALTTVGASLGQNRPFGFAYDCVPESARAARCAELNRLLGQGGRVEPSNVDEPVCAGLMRRPTSSGASRRRQL